MFNMNKELELNKFDVYQIIRKPKNKHVCPRIFGKKGQSPTVNEHQEHSVRIFRAVMHV
jgi:hypothetical protein